MFSMKQLLPKAKRFFRENLGALFIMPFQILLLVCAGSLIENNSVCANDFAVVAYFSLVIGVVLQLVSLLRIGKKAGECD